MTKKALVGVVNAVVAQVRVAHGLPEGPAGEDTARTLLGLAVQRNADILVGATSPPGVETIEIVGKGEPEGLVEIES